jgi:microcystin-dependent protein
LKICEIGHVPAVLYTALMRQREWRIELEVPIGSVTAFAGKNSTDLEKAGWMICDGRPLDRIRFSQLFAVISTFHGHGDGVNTFNLPDFRGLFLRGVDHDAGRDPEKDGRAPNLSGGNVGNQVGSFQDQQFLSHTHTHGSSENPGGAILATPRQFLAGGNINQGHGNFAIDPSGGSETRPKNCYVEWVIKVQNPG